MQREDFDGLFKAMDGLPVTIRLLDPPLHEFLPQRRGARSPSCAARHRAESVDGRPRAQSSDLHEINPMLGHRGCRLGITYPEITEMQARAIFEAACDVGRGRA